MPGQAIGSTVDRVTGTFEPVSSRGAVAAGTISRSATHSVSSTRPAKGRATNGVLACFGAFSARAVLRRLLMTLSLGSRGAAGS